MPKHKHTSALVLLSDRELTYNEAQLPKLQAAALQQVAMVAQLHREAAARAILAGLTLHRVKASSKHGTFIPWVKANVHSAAYRQCNYYMRLATAFVEKARVSKPDLLALPGDQTSLALEGPEAEGRALLLKLSEFVGSRSLNELLEKHNIKTAPKLGGAHEDKDESAEGDEPQAPIDLEVLASQKRDELARWIEAGRQLLVTENVCQYLPHEDTRAFAKGLESFISEWRSQLKEVLSAAPAEPAA